ncbi:MAG: S41 family peptidase [Streptosporangiaceae bacterium]
MYFRDPHIDGDRVTFVADDDIWLAPADGGRARRLTADQTPANTPRLEPGGDRIAWASTRDGAHEIYVSDLGGETAFRLTHWGEPSTRVAGWTANGEVLAVSAAYQPHRFGSVAWRLPADGGPATQLGYGQVNDLATGLAGTALLTGRLGREPAYWKRYRGGTRGRLWVSRDNSSFARVLPDLQGQLAKPMLIGERLFFLSDHEGTGNIYSVTLEGQDLRRHTDHDGFYVRNPATDGTRIVYHLAGDIWLLENDETRKLDITLESPARAREPRLVTAADDLGGLDVDETGQASAIEVAGTIHWLTHSDGPARALTVTQRARLPRVAGNLVFWVTDSGGADAIEYTGADGESATDVMVAGQVGDVTSLAVSPDGATVATAARDGKVHLVDIASGTVTEVAAGENGESDGLAWSADSEWLAWSQPVLRELRKIRIVRRTEPEVLDVTDGRFTDTEPVFTLDGKYLAFLSRRTFDPVYDAHTFDLSFPNGIRPYLAVLDAATPSPFGPLVAGRPLSEDSSSPERRAVTVDATGLPSRVVGVPVEEARYSALRAVDGGLAWLRSPVTGVLGEGGATPDEDRPRPRLERYDLGKRAVNVVCDELDWFAVSGDGKRFVVRDSGALRVLPAADSAKGEPVTVDLARARTLADPVALWRHAFGEYGRMVRREFWSPDMSGVDWDGVLAAYSPLLAKVRVPGDFADLLYEVAGELGTSHAYVRSADVGDDDMPPPGQLGADLTRTDDGRWIVSRVLTGESSDPLARSPLLAPGAGVAEGTEIVAVDGRPTDSDRGPWPLLAGTAGKPVELTVRSADVVRRVAIVPLKDERRLRYQDWVAGRRAHVRSLSDGRLGYLHVPDMMGNGWAHFHRDLTTEMSFEGLIVDVRGNGGGHTSELIVEKLARTVIGWDTGRYLRSVTYPREAPRGPVVALADEFAGSDGDIVTAAIKLLGLAPVVGARTWGGVIGIDGYRKLADGTSVTAPRYAIWFDEHGWDVENYGVDPDVEVLQVPGTAGDVQLETAVRMALEALEKRPAAVPPVIPVPGAVSKARPPLPPRVTGG